MVDVFKDLAKLSFRDIIVPCAGPSGSLTHESIIHTQQYKDKGSVESTGLGNWTHTYLIPFREGLQRPPYNESMFLDRFPKFIAACEDRTPAILVRPILGPILAKCTSIRYDGDIQKRDGVDVTVEFIEAPDPNEQAQNQDGAPETTQDLISDDAAFGQELEKVDFENEEPPTALVNPLDAIDGVGQQVLLQGDKIGGTLAGYTQRLATIENTLDKLTDPKNEPVRRESRRLREQTIRLNRKVRDPQRIIVQVTQKAVASMASIAKDADMTIQEFATLNPQLTRQPMVPKGAIIRIHKRDTPSG